MWIAKKYDGIAMFLSHDRIAEIKKDNGFRKIKTMILNIEKKMGTPFYFSCVLNTVLNKKGIFFHFLFETTKLKLKETTVVAVLTYIFNTYRYNKESIFTQMTTTKLIRQAKTTNRDCLSQDIQGNGVTCPLTF